MAKRNRNKALQYMHISATGKAIEGTETAISHALRMAARKSLKDLGFSPIREELKMIDNAKAKRAERAKAKADTIKQNQINAAWFEHSTAA